MAHYNTDAQTQKLIELEQGRRMTLVITGATQNCKLQFRHGNNAEWHDYPNFLGVHTGGVLVEEFTCISGRMQVVFDAAPSEAYTMTNISEAISTY